MFLKGYDRPRVQLSSMKSVVFFVALVFLCLRKFSNAEIRSSSLINRINKIKAVGAPIMRRFMPLTEIPPPAPPKSSGGGYHELPDGRRHLETDCAKKPDPREVIEGGHVNIFGDYYDDGVMKTVATVIIPDHIDHKHFEVTTQVPYLTVGPIEGIGYHPTTITTGECEKIYQDHIAEQYSDETKDYSEESLEMARMPLMVEGTVAPFEEHDFHNQYSDQQL